MRRLIGSTRRAVGWLGLVLEDRCLNGEQRRGVLGPAHRWWRPRPMITVGTGRLAIGARSGEEWTASPEWKHGLIEDVLARWIPDGGVVLEIGPGAGVGRGFSLRVRLGSLADVSERRLELCRERFEGDARTQYVLCAGSDLPGVQDGSIEAVWSFDVRSRRAERSGDLSRGDRVGARAWRDGGPAPRGRT